MEHPSTQWKKLYVQSQAPEQLEDLERLSKNLWWSWNYEATQLFASIDEEQWEAVGHNPIALLDQLDQADYTKLTQDQDFMKRLKQVVTTFDAYMAEKKQEEQPRISYFCMEYGLHASFKLYSGGLGVLAGDFLKEASDENVDMVGMGLLYRYGYFRQGLTYHGEQVAHYDPQRFTYLPVEPVRDQDGTWIKVEVALPERTLHAKLWRASVGRIPLYLLDTDVEENREEDRVITHQLYGGDRENRLKQEILLGIGGIRAIRAIGLDPDVYHLNEGHAAFIGLERLRHFVQSGLNVGEATEVIRASSLFTTHTPVPAGHDSFAESMMWPYFSEFASSMGLPWEKFIALGRINGDNRDEDFSMSHLAAKLSQQVNGVSRIHGRVSRDMFQHLYEGFEADELHIDYVTNSVHYPTWTAPDLQKLYRSTFGKDFLPHQADPAVWAKIRDVKDADLVSIKQQQKKALIDLLKVRLEKNMQLRHESPPKIMQTLSALNENALVLGFARRFATYKRAQLMFTDLERLAQIVNRPEQPVQFLFAGKAHPADQGGQALIKHIMEVSSRPEFIGKVIFLEDYDMDLASALVKGVDVWLNTPTRPLEASGTSGMKATMNGGLNFSVLDGWWAEGYRPDAGWALPEERAYDNQDVQNELDAATIYTVLENEIIPQYYDRNKAGISAQWVARMKNTIAHIAPQFTMKRMMDDYHDKFYRKLYASHRAVRANDYQRAKELAQWKVKVASAWDQINVVQRDVYNFANDPLPLGETFKAEIVLDIRDLKPEDVGVELLIAKQHDGQHDIVLTKEFEKKKVTSKALATAEGEETETGQLVEYTCNEKITFSGVYDYGFRVFAQHEGLAHRQEFSLVKWV